ncbi:hypothetical protein T11_18621 [Trichinella zimbabwensis]|uniref:Uncharacterized protein n=1 Tax=Trichinella zimbabwensis TaxID=268475 RepID=A0A0V1FBV4_9BILA|nr:hypothetical protein T11_18621 [Trichinella zimbabwensis]
MISNYPRRQAWSINGSFICHRDFHSYCPKRCKNSRPTISLFLNLNPVHLDGIIVLRKTEMV